MQTPALLLGQVYDQIFDIKSKIEDVEKLKERLEHLDDENIESTFNETKTVINSLCELVTNIEKHFAVSYEAWVSRKSKDNSECANGEAASSPDTTQEKRDSPKGSPSPNKEHNDTDSESTNIKKAQTNGFDNNDDDSNLSLHSASSKDPLENVEKNTSNVDTESTKQKNTFGLIKVIDIKKLIDPNKVVIDENKNSEKIKDSDSDVVIISDTEDKSKTKTKKDTKRKNKRKRTGSDDSDINKEAQASRTRRKQKLEVLKDTFATFREKRATVKKITFKEISETDSSDDNDSDAIELSDTRPKHKTKTKSISPQKTKELCDAQSDKKYSWKAYVPLLRIPCEKLKEYYLNILEDAEINKLTNLDTLDKTSKQSTSNGGTKKVKKKSKSSNKDDKSKENSSDSDVSCSDKNVDYASDKSDKMSTHNNAENSGGDDVNLDGICASPVVSNGEETDGDSVSKKEKTSKKKSEKKEENESPDKSDCEKNSNSNASGTDKSKKKWRKDPLLTSKLSDSDSDEQFTKYKKKLDKPNRLKYRKIIGSDSEGEEGKTKSASDSDTSKSKDQNSDSEKETNKNKKKTKRRRIREVESSSDEGDKSTRKQIRKVIANSSLAETTKLAQKEEAERKARIAERQKKYNNICDADYPTDAKVEEVVLDFDDETNEKLLSVHPDIVKNLKPHQAAGVQFMWNACFESLKRSSESKGSGCILAHCMGLGKTLQVIALCHTLLTNGDKTGIRKVLVVCPLNTVLNWVAEFKQWLPKDDEIELFELNSFKANYERKYQTEEWHRCGGVFIISYDMFRNLTKDENKRIPKKMRNVFKETLVDPGPDLVVCDEGHLLKNEKTSISIAMNLLKTSRRIVLTGTPLQNNLKEYWCMVQFVKPNLLGTYKEYLNRFVNPITNGQYTDSTPHDIHIMRKRSHVLHKLLDGIVQRRDYSVLAPYLPPKHEYVLFLSLTEIQVKLYKHYLNEYARKPGDGEKIGKTSFLFADFQEFQRICTHPRVLLDKSIEVKIARDKQDLFFDEDSEGSLKDFINDDDDDKSTTSPSSSSSEEDKSDDEGDSDKSGKKSKQKVQTGRLTRSNAALVGSIEQIEEQNKEEEPPEWWQQYVDNEELDVLNHGTKLFLLFEILKQCEAIGDKVLVFSQSLYSLNIIEYFLNKIDEATQNDSSVNGYTGSWSKGLDYYRLDGSSSCENRSAWCKSFNSESNTRARLFLISTRAGGLGINLVAANRVVIFDVSWNPSHDIQSIYRVYRFGQKKPCYIYRFVMYGTMEMKIYERQVTKQAISKRVIDEQQIDRHYNQNDLAELYKFDQIPEERPTPLVPKDVLLAELLQNLPQQIYRYHEHQTLLENKEDEVLNEEERKAAWEEYETEKTVRQQQQPVFNDSISMLMQNLPIPAIVAAFTSMLKKSKPDITPVHLNNAMSSLFTQLRLQLASGMTALYDKIIAELMMLNMKENQRYKEVCEYMIINRPQPGIPQYPYVQQTSNFYPNTNKPMTSSNEVIELLD